MSLDALRQVASNLPIVLRDQVNDYAVFVHEVSESIFSEMGIQPTAKQIDDFIFLAGIHRLWTLIDSQYWILDNSLTLLEQHEVHSIRIHSNVYEKRSDAYLRLKSLRTDLSKQLENLGIGFVKETMNLHSLAEQISGGGHGHP